MSLYGDLPPSGSVGNTEWTETRKDTKPTKESAPVDKVEAKSHHEQVKKDAPAVTAPTTWSANTKFLQQAVSRKKANVKQAKKPTTVALVLPVESVEPEKPEEESADKFVSNVLIPAKDRYDPSKPNDYDELKQQQDRRKKKEKAKLLSEAIEEQSRKIKKPRTEKPPEKKYFDPEAATGEDAFLRRNNIGKPKEEPSPVITLINLVAPWNIDGELEGETRDECEKFGPVEKCIVYNAKNVPETEAVRVFVHFKSSSSAVKGAFLCWQLTVIAVKVMNGRLFGGRTVRAIPFDLNRFLRLDLKPRADEMIAQE
jgi:hypothetical protein